MKVYSYVVEHDTGYAPNPYFDFCTLCRCKFRGSATGRKNIVELANEGDWVVGTGGAGRKSADHGKLVYAMRVDKKLTRQDYFNDTRFARKKPTKMATSTYEQTRGDNEEPRRKFEKQQFALISQHFYYFGAYAKDIPRNFDHLEKKGSGFRCDFDSAYIRRFVEWLQENYRAGRQGDPCYREPVEKPKGGKRCKSSY